jgi:hypothetical protein
MHVFTYRSRCRNVGYKFDTNTPSSHRNKIPIAHRIHCIDIKLDLVSLSVACQLFETVCVSVNDAHASAHTREPAAFAPV